jgi:hypothetical protein
VSKKYLESGTKKSHAKMDRIFGRGESNLLQATGLPRLFLRKLDVYRTPRSYPGRGYYRQNGGGVPQKDVEVA